MHCLVTPGGCWYGHSLPIHLSLGHRNMGLNREQLSQRLKSPKRRDVLQQAETHHKRLRFHTEPSLSMFQHSRLSDTAFLQWVESMLPGDKFHLFVTLFRHPLLSVQLVEEIYGSLHKVFEGRDAYERISFKDSEAQSDWEKYRVEQLDEPEFWSTTLWEEMKVSVNSVMVVDMAREKGTGAPEPYSYFVQPEQILDYDTAKKGNAFQWIAFQEQPDEVIYIDEAGYYVYAYKDAELGAELVANPHTLGACPVRWTWTDTLIHGMPDLKAAPISGKLSRLDWYLMFAISKQSLDLYAAYPIYAAYEEECDYKDSETDDYCDRGWLKSSAGHYIHNGSALAPCPRCGKRALLGPGTIIDIPIPKKDQTNLGDPVTIVQVDRQGLDYNVEEVERIRREIFTGVVGYGGEISRNQAVNEKQIVAAFEGRTAVLNRLKRNIELLQDWRTDTICKLRYAERYNNCTHSRGTTYYLYTVGELYELYSMALEAEVSDYLLDSILDHIIATENRNNPAGMERSKMLQELTHFPHLSTDKLLTLAEKEIISRADLVVRLDLSTLAKRFERENGNMVDFGIDTMDYRKRITSINQTLLSYVNTKEPDAGREPGSDTGTDDAAGSGAQGQDAD